MEIVAGLLALGIAALAWLLVRERGRQEALLSELRTDLAHDRAETTRAVLDTTMAVARQQLDGARAHADQADAGRDAVLTEQLASMSGDLDRVRQLVVRLEQQRATDHGTLSEQLRDAARNAQLLAETTDGLRAALQNSRVRGQWGERMADDVLRAAGFREGINYHRQATTDQGRPDFEFLLPRGRSVFMDVKFPLDNYLRHLEADAPAEADVAARAFVRDARNRIRELADRGYADPADALSVVLLFVPNDAVFAFALECEPGLLDEALARSVLLCSPSTLFGVLAVIRQSVEAFQVDQSSGEILEALASFQGQWEKFVEAMDKHGRQLATATRSFEALVSTRRNQLERTLDEVERLREDRGLALPSERIISLAVAASDELADDQPDADEIDEAEAGAAQAS